jgi:hypothetical protein
MATLTHEAVKSLAQGRAREIVFEAVNLCPRPCSGLAASIEAARKELTSRLTFGYLDVLLRGRQSAQWRELLICADSLLPRSCSGCGTAVWPYERHGSPVYRCSDCWRVLVIGARLVARAETEVEAESWVATDAFPNLGLDQ